MSDGAPVERVVVLGAGYAGLMAALRLAGRTRQGGPRLTLVSRDADFVERIRLHQLAAGQPLARHRIAELLRGTGVAFVQANVVGLDPDRCVVELDSGRIGFDRLIYALGSATDDASVPGVRPHAHGLGDRASAAALGQRLAALAGNGGRLLVVGGGATGIEAACELAEAHPRLRTTLVTRGAFGEDLTPRGRAHVRGALARLGVTLRERASAQAVGPGVVELADGERLGFELCLWAGAFRVPALAREAGLAVNARGQLLVDAQLRSLSHPRILGVGDAAAPAADVGATIRMACATALPMGAHAADVLAAACRGGIPRPFRFAYQIRCLSLGRRDGLIQLVTPDDAPRERVLRGRLGALVKEQVCRYALRSLRLERRFPGFFRWPGARWRARDTATGARPSAPGAPTRRTPPR